MIEKLSKEEEGLMDPVRDEWLEIGLATAKSINRSAAKEAVMLAYTRAGLKTPEFVYFAHSPREGALKVALLLRQNPDGDMNIKPHNASQLTKMTAELMTEEVLPNDIAQHMQNAFQWSCYGQHDAGWLSFYDYFQRIGVDGLEQLEGLKKAAHWCGWWWAMENVVVISERPGKLFRDDRGRLHREDEMAISYGDRWGLHCWHGIVVPAHIIERPNDITVEGIMGENNQELRRIMIERMGSANFLKNAKAKLVSEDLDKLGLPRRVWDVSFQRDGDEPWRCLQVFNSTVEHDGTHREYVLQVPPTVSTPQEALAWGFDMDPGEYNPVQEA